MMFLLKHQGLVIRPKKVSNQIKEMAWKILAYNIDRMARALQLLLRVIRLWTTPLITDFQSRSHDMISTKTKLLQ